MTVFCRHLSRPRLTGRRIRPAMALFAVPLLLSVSLPVQAESLAKAMARYTEVYYQPQPLESVDEAARSIYNIQPFISLWGGGYGSKVNVNRDGVAIDSSYSYTQSTSHWNPVSGGAWVGNSYVPIFGGSTTTSQETVNVNRANWIDLKDIKSIFLRNDPKYKKYAWGWRVVLLHSNGTMHVILAKDETIAKKLIDSFATLAAQFNTDFLSSDNWGIHYALERELIVKSQENPVYGWRVINVDVGGPGELAGVRKNDYIISKRYVRSDGSDEWRPFSQEPRICSSRTHMRINIMRKGNITEVPLSFDNMQRSYWGRLSQFDAKTREIPRYIGIYFADIDDRHREAGAYPEGAGQAVWCVWQGSLGDRLGLNPGDYVAEINGSKISATDQVRSAFTSARANTAKVWREGKFVALREKGVPQELGVAVRQLNPDEIQKYSLDQGSGIVISGVENGSLAQAIGLVSGDILLSINDKGITSSQVLREILDSEDVVKVRVLRNGSVIEFGKAERF